MRPDIKKIGILGAGQLSLMLGEAAQNLGLSPHVFSPSENEPAHKKFRSGVVGDLKDAAALERFFEGLDLVTYESDFIPFELLRKFKTVNFVPDLKLLEKVSDKTNQKQILEAANIPVPAFDVLDSLQDPAAWLDRVAERWKSGFVLKWARGGYDGKGVWISQSNTGVPPLKFIEEGVLRGTGVFAEEMIQFKREISKICVYSTVGDFRTYPLVVSKQSGGICDYVYGPASEFGFSKSKEAKIDELLLNLAKQNSLYGTFAVEMFETNDGGFVANEIAPRVHNTGHFSLSVKTTSQFENHLRAVLGMPLGSTEVREIFLMKNILGTKAVANVSAPEKLKEGWELKWYEKSDLRVGRKMGHINCVGFDKLNLEMKLKEIESWINAWTESTGQRE